MTCISSSQIGGKDIHWWLSSWNAFRSSWPLLMIQRGSIIWAILLVMFTGLQVAVLLVLDATTCQHPVHVEAALVLHAMQHDMIQPIPRSGSRRTQIIPILIYSDNSPLCFPSMRPANMTEKPPVRKASQMIQHPFSAPTLDAASSIPILAVSFFLLNYN